MRRVVITGIGVVTPAGTTKQIFFENIKKEQSCFTYGDIYGEGISSQYVGKINGQLNFLPPRATKKLDKFSIYSLKAGTDALRDSNIDPKNIDKSRVGVLVGNCYGGWEYVMPQLNGLYGSDGFDAINPYVATAWFPTNPQGELSIMHKILGYSKTLSAGKLSSGLAIKHAVQIIKENKLDIVLAGGCEAPLTPLVYNALREEGVISSNNSFNFVNGDQDGCLIGEGATFLILEELEHAKKRNAEIYAEFSGYGMGQNLEESMFNSLKESSLNPNFINHIIMDASGKVRWDTEELEAINKVIINKRTNNKDVITSAPKTKFGNLFGAANATDIAIATLFIKDAFTHAKQINDEDSPSKTGKYLSANNSVMVNSRDYDGQSLSMIVSEYIE
jgi:3-oxoacyl-[acyl-carrier-protein] synthase II